MGYKISKTISFEKTFYNLIDKSKETKIDTMKIVDDFLYYENKGVQIVKLPCKKDSMSAIDILPNVKKNINEFISELSDEKL